MSLPTVPSDLPFPPGSSAAVRAGAADIRATIPSLRTARAAAEHLEDIARGVHWRGDAFAAYQRRCERGSLTPAIDRAIEWMTVAADRLDHFSSRFDANTDTIGWCRSRLVALGIEGGSVPDELVPEVQRIGWDADRAWADHRAALADVADLFDWLDDQPTFAEPPPSNWDRVRGGAGHVWSFGVGITEGTWEMVSFTAELMAFTNPLTGPLEWREAWHSREQIRAVFDYARDNPGEFATEVGRAVIDLDTLTEDGVARWLGHRVPDVVVALATGGAGSATTRVAALSPRMRRRLDAFVVNALTGRLAAVEAYTTGVALVDDED